MTEEAERSVRFPRKRQRGLREKVMCKQRPSGKRAEKFSKVFWKARQKDKSTACSAVDCMHTPRRKSKQKKKKRWRRHLLFAVYIHLKRECFCIWSDACFSVTKGVTPDALFVSLLVRVTVDRRLLTSLPLSFRPLSFFCNLIRETAPVGLFSSFLLLARLSSFCPFLSTPVLSFFFALSAPPSRLPGKDQRRRGRWRESASETKRRRVLSPSSFSVSVSSSVSQFLRAFFRFFLSSLPSPCFFLDAVMPAKEDKEETSAQKKTPNSSRSSGDSPDVEGNAFASSSSLASSASHPPLLPHGDEGDHEGEGLNEAFPLDFAASSASRGKKRKRKNASDQRRAARRAAKQTPLHTPHTAELLPRKEEEESSPTGSRRRRESSESHEDGGDSDEAREARKRGGREGDDWESREKKEEKKKEEGSGAETKNKKIRKDAVDEEEEDMLRLSRSGDVSGLRKLLKVPAPGEGPLKCDESQSFLLHCKDKFQRYERGGREKDRRRCIKGHTVLTAVVIVIRCTYTWDFACSGVGVHTPGEKEVDRALDVLFFLVNVDTRGAQNPSRSERLPAVFLALGDYERKIASLKTTETPHRRANFFTLVPSVPALRRLCVVGDGFQEKGQFYDGTAPWLCIWGCVGIFFHSDVHTPERNRHLE